MYINICYIIININRETLTSYTILLLLTSLLIYIYIYFILLYIMSY